MSTRSPIGRPIIGRPRRGQTVESSETGSAVRTTGSHHNRHGSAHNKDDVVSIPQVPRIPDRFQPRPENRDLDLDQRYMRDWKGKMKIDLKSIPAPHTRYLPNCSIGKPKEVQVISNAMMQAYIAMRGNYLGGQDGNDPLFQWIQQREELAQASKPNIHHKRDVSRMLQLIDEALESSNMGGDSPRDCIFEVYRPDLEHIKPPQDIDMSPHIFAASCNDFEWEDDSDDEEANVPSGRISPCTFLEWSKDCVRWNADNIENKKDTSSYVRMRPPTPKIPAPPRSHEHIPRGRLEAQWDIYTGEELTPTYYVPTSPSIIYTPPGVDFVGFRTPNFHAQYRRMAPLAERQLRNRIYGGQDIFPGLSDGDKDTFSTSSVDAATSIVPELHNLRGAEIDAMLRGQWAAVAQAEEAERALRRQAEQQAAHIARLRSDQRHLHRFLPALHVRRELRDREAERRRRRRGENIRAYVADQAVDAQSRLETACFRLHSAQAKVHRNTLSIADLEHEVHELCLSAGVRDPGQAYAVLMGEEEEGEEEGGGGRAGYGGGHGRGFGAYGGGPPMGPWSASSLGRAEEEFDRLVADMQMGRARDGEADLEGWEGSRDDDDDDDESGDSGVAGVGSRGRGYSRRQDPTGAEYDV